MALEANSETFVITPSTDAQRPQTCLASTQDLRSRRVCSAKKSPDYVVAHRSDRCFSPVRPVRPTGQTGPMLLHLRLRFFGLGFVDQPRNPWFSGEPLETPRTWCSLCQLPLVTRLPRSPGSTLVLRLNHETVHDFILLFLPPCGPHLNPLATGSLERSLLVFSTPGGLTGDDLSHLFFTCTNASQDTTYTCNTEPRISPHNVINHSSHQEATIHRSSNHTWYSISP
jgi:hypothetical protein